MDKLVLGIGLPRTGTTSLSQALDMLGYSGAHECLLHPNREATCKQTSKTYRVYNWYYTIYKDLLELHPHAYYILTTRDQLAWEVSIARFPPDTVETIPKVKDYELDVSGYFAQRSSRLLVFNIWESNPWVQLCEFLEEPIPEALFPHSNTA